MAMEDEGGKGGEGRGRKKEEDGSLALPRLCVTSTKRDHAVLQSSSSQDPPLRSAWHGPDEGEDR